MIKHVYTLSGNPINYVYLPYLKQVDRREQQLKLSMKQNELQIQHPYEEPLTGPLTIQVTFLIQPPRTQKHIHYLPDGYTIYNLIRYVQKASEDVIYIRNAYIDGFTSELHYDKDPRTIITIIRNQDG